MVLSLARGLYHMKSFVKTMCSVGCRAGTYMMVTLAGFGCYVTLALILFKERERLSQKRRIFDRISMNK